MGARSLIVMAELDEIVSELLELVPPGEVKDVERDIRCIADPAAPPSEAAFATGFSKYNEKEMVSVTHDGQSILLSTKGSLGDNKYLDPRNSAVITVDPVKQEVLSSEPMSDDMQGSDPALRTAIDEAAQAYCCEAFADGAVCAVYPDLSICISSRIYAPQKAWTGRWQSQYTFANGNLQGKIGVSIHYYEFGNTVKTATFDVAAVPVAADGGAIIEAIREIELRYHQASSVQAADLKEQFKSLRRQLPITKSKIDWLKIQTEAKVKGELEGLK